MRPKPLYCLLFVLFLCAPAVPNRAQTSAPPNTLLVIQNGALIDGTGAAPVADGVLVIQGDRILAAGSREKVPIPGGAQVLDAGGGAILPGFINAHVHFGYNEKNLAAWAQGGITTVRDEGIIAESNRTLEELIAFRNQAAKNPALAQLVSAGYMITVPNGYGQLRVESIEDARLQAERELKVGVDLLKVSMEDGYAGNSGLPKLTKEQLQAIVAAAHQRATVVSGHITQARYIPPLLDAGVDDIAHTAYDRISDDTLQRMARENVALVPTFTVFRNYGTPENICIDNVRRFAALGGLIGLGNDFGGGPGEFETGIPLYEIDCLGRAGLTPMQIIQTATLNAARICRLDKELGTLEPGRLADVLVVRGNPLQDLRALQSIRYVLRSGRVIRDTP